MPGVTIGENARHSAVLQTHKIPRKHYGVKASDLHLSYSIQLNKLVCFQFRLKVHCTHIFSIVLDSRQRQFYDLLLTESLIPIFASHPIFSFALDGFPSIIGQHSVGRIYYRFDNHGFLVDFDRWRLITSYFFNNSRFVDSLIKIKFI